MLRSAGLPRAEAESQSTEVVRALQGVLQDAKGRWILGARAGAQTETSWSGWSGSAGAEVVRTLRGDRIFRAGATPVPPKKHTCGSWTTKPPATAHRGWMLFSKPKKKNTCTSSKLMPSHAQGSRGRPAPAVGTLLSAAHPAGLVVENFFELTCLVAPGADADYAVSPLSATSLGKGHSKNGQAGDWERSGIPAPAQAGLEHGRNVEKIDRQ